MMEDKLVIALMLGSLVLFALVGAVVLIRDHSKKNKEAQDALNDVFNLWR